MGRAKMSEVRRQGNSSPTASLLSVRWPLAHTSRVSPAHGELTIEKVVECFPSYQNIC